MGREKIKKGCCPLLGILHDGISSESLSSLFVSSPVKLRLTCEGLQVWQHWRHIKPAPKQTQLWASTQHLHDNSNRNSSRWSSLSQAVHYGWAAKPGPSSAPRVFLFLRLVRIRKKKKRKRKTRHLKDVSETKCIRVESGFSGALLKRLGSLVPHAVSTRMCTCTHAPSSLPHTCLYYKQGFNQHHSHLTITKY